MKTVAIILGIILLLAVLVLAIGWWRMRAPDIPAATLEARYGRPESHYVDVGGGLRLHYLDRGPADAPPVILIHGYGDNCFSWDGWADALAKRYRVIAVDLPGHGLSNAPAGYVADPGRFADAIAALADKIGLPAAAVAGNSLGGAVSWNLALRHPDRVSRLILVDSAGFMQDTMQGKMPIAFKLMQYQWGRDLIASIDSTPLIREGLQKNFFDHNALTDDFITRWATLQRYPGHRQLLMTVRPGDIVASDETLAPIKAPTLILWGDRDPLIKVASADRFHRAIAGSKVVRYPDAGHQPQTEIPARSVADVAAFLAATGY